MIRRGYKVPLITDAVKAVNEAGETKSLKEMKDAIGKALLHGASRYSDAWRGHGLAAVRRFVNQWNGRISIRSGTARLSIIPKWAWGNEKEQNLTHFPGA